MPTASLAGKIVLVTGGCRSGKSAFALDYAEQEQPPGNRFFIATCPVLDDEMRRRIDRHQAERAGRGWAVREEEVDLAAALRAAPDDAAALVDCLTLWVNNIMHHRPSGGDPGEDDLAALAGTFLAAARERRGTTVFVANEVGLGVVPENAMARRFRDLAGRVNQTVAQAADEVYFMVAGLSMRMK
ncbi:MAG: bifunctional adenosylcobinamide kinase/adenosylcobinamide-phosphate guanylyltransferase [Planctomycetaceae bacterium]|nr:bifunctional adenosylcobinamide kinase/adenosylcobinamide-phosphate guanylyltransferase [Planctomycetaceae bacterium]